MSLRRSLRPRHREEKKTVSISICIFNLFIRSTKARRSEYVFAGSTIFDDIGDQPCDRIT